jgi:hypothetical protein
MARKALLVGINNYQGVSDLRGCVNDVTNMRNVLKTHMGFSNQDIRVLVDERATKENILNRLNWLLRGAKSGDFLIFHFSGHGSQIRDRDGDELQDNLDELICPYDMNWDGSYITDDELNNLFKRIPQGVRLEVFLDACHSGTALRSIDSGLVADFAPAAQIASLAPAAAFTPSAGLIQSGVTGRAARLGAQGQPAPYAGIASPYVTLNRFLQPPVDIRARFEGDEEELQPTKRFQDIAKDSMQTVLWAACQDQQTAADAYINGSFNGAFTYYLCRHLRDTAATLNRQELIKRVRQSLQHSGFGQTPQLECDPILRAAREWALEVRRTDGPISPRAAVRLQERTKVTSMAPSSTRATTLKVAK